MSDTTRQTLGEMVGADRLAELADHYVEKLADDADPNAPDFRREVTMAQARDLQVLGSDAEQMFAYACLHFFIWRDELFCRICGCQVLAAWMIQHRDRMHTPSFGF